MSEISVIGLGSMGSTLAKTLLSAGHAVTVWNRSQEKAELLVGDGAEIGVTVAEAVEASPVTLVCIDNYTTTRNIFASNEVLSVLSNRIIVQMSSGTPLEAVAHESWFLEKGAGYLDAAILGSPKVIGTKAGQILIAGDGNLWEKCNATLECLVGNFQHTGSKIDSAKVLDLAWLSQRLGYFMGVFQGLLLCEAGGIGLDVFSTTVAVDARASMIANTIHTNTFNDPINTVKVWNEALHHVQSHAKELGINTEVLDFVADKFQRAQSAGYMEEDLAALIKIFR